MTAEPEVVVITGESGGLERATACAFARRGAKIALLARGQERLDQAVQELKRRGAADAMGIMADVADAKHGIRGFTDSVRTIRLLIIPLGLSIAGALLFSTMAFGTD